MPEFYQSLLVAFGGVAIGAILAKVGLAVLRRAAHDHKAHPAE